MKDECRNENCPMRNGEVSNECKFDDCPYRYTDRPSWEGLILFLMKKAFEGKSQPPEAEK